ncbi:unnamed protein product [Musa hybrid cultivar]
MLLMWRKILWSIKFNFVVCYNKKSKYTNEITIDELQSPLLVHEKKSSNMIKKSTINQKGYTCGDKDTSSPIDEFFQSMVKFENDSIVFIMGKRNVKIQTKNYLIQTISDVLFIPNLKRNLVNIRQLQEKGYEIHFY